MLKAKSEYVMDDFEATVVAQDAIRIDMYDDDIESSRAGRYTKIVSKCTAMGIVVLMIKAIEQLEINEAIGAKGTKK